jgi:hypothetical protein
MENPLSGGKIQKKKRKKRRGPRRVISAGLKAQGHPHLGVRAERTYGRQRERAQASTDARKELARNRNGRAKAGLKTGGKINVCRRAPEAPRRVGSFRVLGISISREGLKRRAFLTRI